MLRWVNTTHLGLSGTQNGRSHQDQVTLLRHRIEQIFFSGALALTAVNHMPSDYTTLAPDAYSEIILTNRKYLPVKSYSSNHPWDSEAYTSAIITRK